MKKTIHVLAVVGFRLAVVAVIAFAAVHSI